MFRRGWALLWMVGCGPVVTPSDGDGDGTTAGDATTTNGPPPVTSTPTVTTTPTVPPPVTTAPGTTTSPGTSSTGFASSTGPPPVEVEGTVVGLDWGEPVLAICDGPTPEVCIEGLPFEYTGCAGLYVRGTGTLHEQEGGFIGRTCTRPYDLFMDEVVEVRPCTPADCGGAAVCPPVSCEPLWYCWPFRQDCPDGELCRLHYGGPEIPFRVTACLPIDGSEGALGDPCTVQDPDVDGVDDCGPGLHCRANVLDGDAGLCAPYCFDGEQCGVDDCSQCDEFPGVGLCVPSGETVNGSC